MLSTINRYFSSLIQRAYNLNSRLPEPEQFVWPLTSLIFFVSSTYTVALHNSYRTGALDLGRYVGAYWTALNTNKIMYSPVVESSYFAIHFAPIKFLTVAWYAIFPGPTFLLILKSLLIALGFTALWYVGNEVLESGWLALGISAAFITNRFLIEAWLFDIQEQMYLPVLLSLFYLAYKRQSRKAVIALSILIFFTNEFVVVLFVPFLFGLLLNEYLENGDSRTSRDLLALCMIGTVYFAISLWIIVQFSPKVGSASSGQFMSVLQPAELAAQLFERSTFKLESLLLFLSSMLFLSLLDIAFVLAIAPYLFYAWIIATSPMYAGFNAHYALYVLPFAAIGAIRALEKIQPSQSVKQYLAVLLLLIAGIHGAMGASYAVDTGQVPVQNEHTDAIDSLVQEVPETASVATQSNIQPHLAERRYSYMTPPPNGVTHPDFVLIDITPQADWYAFDLGAFGFTEHYRLVESKNGVWLFAETGTVEERSLRETPGIYEIPLQEFSVKKGELTDGQIRHVPTAGPGIIWFGPYLRLPGGNYTVTYELRVEGEGALTVDSTAKAGGRVFESKTINSTTGWENRSLTFTMDRPFQKIEFRGTATGEVDVAVKNITLVRNNCSTHSC